MNPNVFKSLYYNLSAHSPICHITCNHTGEILETSKATQKSYGSHYNLHDTIFLLIPELKDKWNNLKPESITMCSLNQKDQILIVFSKNSDIVELALFPLDYHSLQNILNAYTLFMTIKGNIKDFFLFVDGEGKILECNMHFSDYISRKNIKGMFIDDFLHNPPKYQIISKQLEDSNFIEEIELCFRGKRNNTVFGLATVNRFIHDDKHLDLICIKNISKRVNVLSNYLKTSMELVETNEKLKNTQTTMFHQEKMASIGQLAAGLAHEINNPLSYINNNMYTMQRYIDNSQRFIEAVRLLYNESEKERNFTINHLKTMDDSMDLSYVFDDSKAIVKENKEGFKRVDEILQSLKHFAATEESDERSIYDVNKSLDSILNITKNEYKYNLKIIRKFSEIPNTICDTQQLNQALLNIIMNSIEAIKSQERKDFGLLELRTKSDDNFIIIDVKDDGPGIPSNIINEVFNPFFSTKEVGKGTGLGLSIAHNVIVNKHGGEMEIISSGKGTTVSIKLPLVIEI